MSSKLGAGTLATEALAGENIMSQSKQTKVFVQPMTSLAYTRVPELGTRCMFFRA